MTAYPDQIQSGQGVVNHSHSSEMSGMMVSWAVVYEHS